MRRVGILAVGLAWNDDADRWLLRLHGADLHWRGVGAQHLALAAGVWREEKGVVHLARRMADGEVQRREIVIVGLDVRAFRDVEAEIAENGGDLVDHLADRVDAAALGRRLAHRQGNVDPLGFEPRGDRGVAQRCAPVRQRVGDALLQPVDRRSHLLAFLGRHAAEHLEAFRNGTLLAESGYAHRFERGFVRRGADLGEQRRFEGLQVCHLFGHGLVVPFGLVMQ